MMKKMNLRQVIQYYEKNLELVWKKVKEDYVKNQA